MMRSVVDQKMLKRREGGPKDYVSAPLLFIANAYNELQGGLKSKLLPNYQNIVLNCIKSCQ